ncbi:hypothetical protein MBLNU459_g5413t1 [Dothideomycetes sp. NU459]
MTTQAPEDQVKFLVACFRNANPKPGKIDWNAVAAECGIITSGAAAKRWERLLKANGIAPSSITGARNGDSASNPQTPQKEQPAKGPSSLAKTPAKASKKRKAVDSDDEEHGQSVKAAKHGGDNEEEHKDNEHHVKKELDFVVCIH